MLNEHGDICWAPRVPQRAIRRLYRAEAGGLPDPSLVDDVGMALYVRCHSILTVGNAQEGRAACLRCRTAGVETIILRNTRDKAELLVCPVCGWSILWGDYHASFHRKQLCIGRIRGAVERYLRDYAVARDPKQKMIAIDQLIHEFHHNLIHGVSRPTRAAAVNLIAGPHGEVVALLDSISRDDLTALPTTEATAVWREHAAVMSRLWRRGEPQP